MTTSTVLVKIKATSPLIPYSFQPKVMGKIYEARLLDSGMYAVSIGKDSGTKQVEWAFDPREVEVI